MNWGDWVFNSENLTLNNEAQGYEIDLEEIYSSAEILDWIYQVFGRNWGNSKTIYDLLCAFNEIVDPQANYCSFGEDKKSDGGKLARDFANYHPEN
ncbi:hypothetical protein [Anabaena sp. UHCC 0399]|uniref:hypothetical protein n=1 Tax=Anabaena sp. UHCC 0399 TaxID=3110238 RepID=UPI002B217CE1|nr:hypothetical protein [Anabaena sp. UHCC 0399]MEA5566898.1 hypothetical protein [Anabaena sp. UHCC 0399]